MLRTAPELPILTTQHNYLFICNHYSSGGFARSRSLSMCARACVCALLYLLKFFSLMNGNILSVRAYLLGTQSSTNCFDCLIALNCFAIKNRIDLLESKTYRFAILVENHLKPTRANMILPSANANKTN